MAFGFPAYHENILDNKVNYSISDLVKLLKNTKFLIISNDDNIVFIKSKINVWSWGEKIEIKLHDNLITIKSNCSFPFQCIDWGKNKENVVQLITILELNNY